MEKEVSARNGRKTKLLVILLPHNNRDSQTTVYGTYLHVQTSVHRWARFHGFLFSLLHPLGQ